MTRANALIELACQSANRVAVGVMALEDSEAFRRVPAFRQRVGNNAAILLADVSSAASSVGSPDYRARVEASRSFRSARAALGALRTDLRLLDSPTYPFCQLTIRQLLELCDELLPVLLAVSVVLHGSDGRAA